MSTNSINETNQVLIDYDDGTVDLVNITGTNLAFSGLNVSYVLNNNYHITTLNGTYILTNTELAADFYVAGVELIGEVAGQIGVSLIRFAECGSATPCSTYFSSTATTFSASYVVYDLGTFNIVQGYNRIMLSTSMYRDKGFMVLLNQTYSGRVVLENAAKNASTWLSDYATSIEYLNLTTLGEQHFQNPSDYSSSQKFRFCLSLITEDSFYTYNYTFVKNYTTSKIFNLNASFVDYNLTNVFDSKQITVNGQWTQWVKMDLKNVSF